MLSRLLLQGRSRSFEDVVISDCGPGTPTEGVIDRVHRLGRRVEVGMLLSDGGRGRARIDAQDWDWLELRVGDIITVRRAEPATRSQASFSA